MVKNPPANAEDMGSIPGPKSPHATEQLSLRATTTEARALQQRVVPTCRKQRKPAQSNEDSRQSQNKMNRLSQTTRLISLEGWDGIGGGREVPGGGDMCIPMADSC